MRHSQLILIVAALCLTACASGTGAQAPASPSPAPTSPSPTPTTSAAVSHLTASGDRKGDVTNIHATCGQQQSVGNGYTAKYISADGTLNGDTFHADLYDPSGPGSWENQIHIYVRVTPPNSDYYSWFTQTTDGISNFNWTAGVQVDSTVPPKTSAGTQAGGLSPNGPLTLIGTIVC
jgi:hypothetical protein